MAHLGKCSSLLSNEKCPQNCENEREEPVCASDGNVYRSVSFIEARKPFTTISRRAQYKSQ
jgi:hypothetical protein